MATPDYAIRIRIVVLARGTATFLYEVMKSV
jgi:hypothetical protein